MAETEQDNAAAYGKMVAKAWRDPAFKAKLLADPHAAFKDAGVSMPAGVTVKVVENTDTHHYLVLPRKPTGELSDEALDRVAGGTLVEETGPSGDAREVVPSYFVQMPLGRKA